MRTLAELSEQTGRPVSKLSEDAQSCLKEMAVKPGGMSVDIWDKFSRWLSRAYKVDYIPSEVAALRELNQTSGLIFLPNHRSYLDPLVLRWVLEQYEFPYTTIHNADMRAGGLRRMFDAIILARGGGSLEDLWSFNEEVVVRAIAAATMPVVSGVGHEIDVTLADLAADLRAPTPSAAAELVVPDREDWLRRLARDEARLRTAIMARLSQRRARLEWLEGRLVQLHPAARLRQHVQRLDELAARLQQAERGRLDRARHRLAALTARFVAASPARRLTLLGARQTTLEARLATAMARRLEQARSRFALATRSLQSLSPLATLERGYAIVFDAQGSVVTDAAAVQPGGMIEARLARGRIKAKVEGHGD